MGDAAAQALAAAPIPDVVTEGPSYPAFSQPLTTVMT